MKNKKIIYISIAVLVLICGIIFLFIRPEPLREDGLTERQYKLVIEKVMDSHIEGMTDTDLRNSWMILNAFNEIGFVENRFPNESGVSMTVWMLDMLDIGEIKELDIEVYQYDPNGHLTQLILNLTNEKNNIYVFSYCQTWGMGLIFEDGWRNGNSLYNSLLHRIIDGQICERWYPYNCRIGR